MTDLSQLSALPSGDRDPIGILVEQNASRLQDLVPVRIGRMLESPFAYYRGTAGTMAADLSSTPSSGQTVLCCGDAHISNFGFFASPERTLLFDLNDFDEGGFAPWEWDVKRLVTSVYIAALDNGETPDAARAAAVATTRAYRKSLRRLHALPAMDRYYFTVDTGNVSELLTRHVKGSDLGKRRAAAAARQVAKAERKAAARNSQQALAKFTVADEGGQHRIVDQPPLTRHVEHVDGGRVESLFREYTSTLREDVAYLLRQFRIVDYVLRVVGVGSVGTRCYIVLLEDREGNPLFLQVKEAQATVLSTYGKVPQFGDNWPSGNGGRVVGSQRVLQAQSDAFLGWTKDVDQRDAEHRVDYYWRQFRDMKLSIDLATLDIDALTGTAKICAGLLARAHSQSSGAAQVAEEIGRSAELDQVMAEFARGYADICFADFEALEQAVAEGVLPAERGL